MSDEMLEYQSDDLFEYQSDQSDSSTASSQVISPIEDVPSTSQLASLIWKYLSETGSSSKGYTFLFPNREAVDDLFDFPGLSVNPHVLTALQSPSPPTIEFFKSLDYVRNSDWVVYALTFEKDGERPGLYIGSGTDRQYGMHIRMRAYDHPINLSSPVVPALIKRAILNGYSLTSRSVLVSLPLPSPSDVPLLRHFFVSLEAAFTFAFWAINYKEDRKGKCPWLISDLTYTGLCTHNPLYEQLAVEGDLELTEEQLAERWQKKKEERRKKSLGGQV
ncbi:MAG: hypothetical protein L6R42_006202 [Xanthoria sp. 1 TBL-2021]|nr:MAG: hypothetical protein L6R42_006202 [Xanthoria sp. 1 TBL-2021]